MYAARSVLDAGGDATAALDALCVFLQRDPLDYRASSRAFVQGSYPAETRRFVSLAAPLEALAAAQRLAALAAPAAAGAGRLAVPTSMVGAGAGTGADPRSAQGGNWLTPAEVAEGTQLVRTRLWARVMKSGDFRARGIFKTKGFTRPGKT